MSRITYQTDDWGNAGHDHIEVTFPGGHHCFITITDDEITLHGSYFFDVDNRAVNKIVVQDRQAEAAPSGGE